MSADNKKNRRELPKESAAEHDSSKNSLKQEYRISMWTLEILACLHRESSQYLTQRTYKDFAEGSDDIVESSFAVALCTHLAPLWCALIRTEYFDDCMDDLLYVVEGKFLLSLFCDREIVIEYSNGKVVRATADESLLMAGHEMAWLLITQGIDLQAASGLQDPDVIEEIMYLTFEIAARLQIVAAPNRPQSVVGGPFSPHLH